MQAASVDCANNRFSTLKECAEYHRVKYKSLHAGIIARGGEFEGQGRKLKVFTVDEEVTIVCHILYKAAIGYGELWKSTRLLLQQVLTRIVAANPQRVTGLENQGQLPSQSWVSRFAKWHNLKLCKCSIISKGRVIVSPQDVSRWFADVGNFFES